jgi:hypothetical protein
MDGNGVSVRANGDAGSVLGNLVRDAGAKLDGAGLHLYHASYVDLVLAATSERGTVSLIAGSHTRSFPYFDTAPWDNCLLLIGDAGYTFNGRTPGASLRLDLDMEQSAPRGTIRFSGEMRSASDGQLVPIELEIAVVLSPFPTRLLGECYNFLKLDGMLGLKWTPYELAGALGRVRVAGAEIALEKIRGSCERGVLTNLKAHDFAIKYEYVAVACPGDDGYGLINFTSHSLFGGGVLSRTLDWYLRKSASALLTIEGGKLTDGNPRGVYSPPQDDPAVTRFENEVDLGPAVLSRQMIETRDRSGRVLYGLREIFTAKGDSAKAEPAKREPAKAEPAKLEPSKAEPSQPASTRLAPTKLAPAPPAHKRGFNRAQVNALLVALILLDIVLSTIALVFPEHWTKVMHGLPYDDPAGLLRRTGAVWVAFVLLQAIALFRWQKQPYWLTLVAGVRFTELFSDWVTIFAAKQMTVGGTIGLLLSPPGNLVFGLILISAYKRLSSGPLPGGSFFTKPWS